MNPILAFGLFRGHYHDKDAVYSEFEYQLQGAQLFACNSSSISESEI